MNPGQKDGFVLRRGEMTRAQLRNKLRSRLEADCARLEKRAADAEAQLAAITADAEARQEALRAAVLRADDLERENTDLANTLNGLRLGLESCTQRRLAAEARTAKLVEALEEILLAERTRRPMPIGWLARADSAVAAAKPHDHIPTTLGPDPDPDRSA